MSIFRNRRKYSEVVHEVDDFRKKSLQVNEICMERLGKTSNRREHFTSSHTWKLIDSRAKFRNETNSFKINERKALQQRCNQLSRGRNGTKRFYPRDEIPLS